MKPGSEPSAVTEIDLRLPGIYLWRIRQPSGNEDTYVGRASKLRSRERAYLNNVQRMIDGLPYRNGGDYRPVHHALRLARERGWSISCTPLENCEKADLGERENHWIATLRPTLNGSAGRIRLVELQGLAPE